MLCRGGPAGLLVPGPGQRQVSSCWCCRAGSLFFRNWSEMTPRVRYEGWDRRFQRLKSYPNVLVRFALSMHMLSAVWGQKDAHAKSNGIQCMLCPWGSRLPRTAPS